MCVAPVAYPVPPVEWRYMFPSFTALHSAVSASWFVTIELVSL